MTARGRNGRQLTATTPVVLSRTLSGYGDSDGVVAERDGKNDSATIAFNLAARTGLARVLRGNAQLASLIAGEVPAGPQAAVWKAVPATASIGSG